jgi:hypothetical protein
MKPAAVIVLTGGPCGGKSSLLRELRARADRRHRWIFVPEAAPLLFHANLDPVTKDFQQAVVGLQTALEDICVGAAAADRSVICHRGTLDALAYWMRNGWAEDDFFAATMPRREHLRRYAGILHLQTAAVGAEPFYRRWPDAHRPETASQAAEIDALCAHAWRGHPRYAFIENAGRDWTAKARLAAAALDDLLAAW